MAVARVKYDGYACTRGSGWKATLLTAQASMVARIAHDRGAWRLKVKRPISRRAMPLCDGGPVFTACTRLWTGRTDHSSSRLRICS